MNLNATDISLEEWKDILKRLTKREPESYHGKKTAIVHNPMNLNNLEKEDAVCILFHPSAILDTIKMVERKLAFEKQVPENVERQPSV